MKRNYVTKALSRSRLMLFTSLVFIAFTGSITTASGQTTIYSTDFGTVANVNPVGWTFTGMGMNTSTNTPSSGYAGASGGVYLGEGNSVTFTNTSGNSQATSPLGTSEAILLVNTTTYSNITVSFGMRKSGAGYNTNATYSFEWSTDGSTYNPITYTEATAGSWGLASGAGLTLPAGAENQPTLYLKWKFIRTGSGSNFKIDDVSVISNPVVSVTPATISFLSNDTTVQENTASANIYLKVTSAGTGSSAVSVSVSALSNASGSEYSLANTTVTFAANAPVNSTAAITVNLTDDATIEDAEYVIVKLYDPQNATPGTITQFAFYIRDNDKLAPVPSNAVSMNLLSSFSNGTSGANSAEIVAHDPGSQRLFIANSIGAKLDIVDFVDPSNPVLISSIPVSPYGNINSVSVKNGLVAAAIENSTNPQDSGKVVFFNTSGVYLNSVKVGMMPDMITFNHAGTKVLTANEGEPNNAYTNDPDGSVSIIDISGGIAALTQANVSHVTFTVYNGQEATLKAQGIRIYGLNASASKDFEPEYITVSPDDSKAWVGLQENNALVEIDLSTNNINYIKALGTKDHSLAGNGFDASNVTKGINIANFPVKGFYLPDAIASYTVGGNAYIISANEGDARAWSGMSEEKRVAQLVLDPVKFPNAAELKNNYVLGRLNVTDKNGDSDNDGDIDTIYAYGSRSFSIWNAATGTLVYDSKDDLEQITAANSFSVLFNASNSNATRKDRSDDKGPEPEGVTIGTIGSNIYAFIALERIGGVMVYDVTNPAAPVFVTYANNRSLPSNGPDLGAEGIIFIPQSQSPNGQHIVIAANEISSSLSIWGIPGCTTPIATSLSVSGNTLAPCSNDAPVLSVAQAGGLSYQWNKNGAPVSGATAHTVAATSTGDYAVTISGSTGCTATSIVKTLTVNSAPVISVAGSTAICSGASITQTLSGAASYSYNSASTTSVFSFTPSASGTYTIVGIDANSCSDTLVNSFVVNTTPTLSIAGSSVACAGSAITQTLSGAASYSYNGVSTASVLSFTPAASGNYTLVGLGAGNCKTTVVKPITVNFLPVVSLYAVPAVICTGESSTLTATGASSYSWSTGSTASEFSLSPAVTATYAVTGTDANGCRSSVTKTITVNSKPAVNASSNMPVICAGESASLTAVGGLTYIWNTGSASSSIVIHPSGTTIYTVTGTNSVNCSAKAVVTQSVSECTSLSEANLNGAEYAVYPNPAVSEITISYGSENTINVKVINALGAVVLEEKDYVSDSKLNVASLARGIYFVHISSQNKQTLKKIIVE